MNSVQAVMAHVSRQFESNASGLQERPESRAAEQPQPCRSYARTGRPESALPRHSGFAAQPEKSGQLAKWLSEPCTYDGSPLNGPDVVDLPRRTRPDSPAPDAPLGSSWLLDRLGGGFQLLAIGVRAPESLDASPCK